MNRVSTFPRGWAGSLALLALQAAAQVPAPAASDEPASRDTPAALLGSESLGSRVAPADARSPLPPGPLTELGDRLRDRGVSLGVALVNGHFRNPSTGLSPGHSANYGELFFSAGLDLEKIAGLRATEVNLTEVLHKPSYNTANYLFQTGSGFTPFPVLNKTSDLANLTLSHRTLNRRLKLEFGRMNLTQQFMVPNMCSGCLISAQATVMNQPGVTKSSWGAVARYDLDDRSTVGVALIEDNPTMWQKTTGWQWRHDTADGYIGMLNYTARRGFEDVALPYKLEAGLFKTTARYDDPLYNTDGTSHVQQPGGTPLQHVGRAGGYVQGRKVIWRRGEGGGFGAPENLAGYGGLVWTPGASQTYPWEAYAGTEWSGFVERNPMAMLGTTVRYLQLSERRALYEQQTRHGYTAMLNAMTGGAVPVVDTPVSRNMFLFDVHGRIGLLPGLFVETSVQYLKNPNAMLPITQDRIRSGYMFNVLLVADFGVLSGLSRLAGDKIF